MKTSSPTSNAVVTVQIERFRNVEGNVHAVLSYNATKNYLLMKWVGYSTDAEIVAALEKMKHWHQTTGKARGCRFHVHDTKEIEGSWAGAMDYICNDFFPECHRVGLSCNISIISPDFFSKMASVTLLNQRDTIIQTILVNTLREAESIISERDTVVI